MVYFIYKVLIQIICNKMLKEAKNKKLQNFKRSLGLFVVAAILVCAFLFMGFSPANFANTELANEQNIATIEECTNAVKVWLSQNYNDGTQIGDIIPIIEGDETFVYCVNFKLNNEPNGYVIICKNSGYKYSSDNHWSDWKRDIDNGYPVYTALSGMKNVNNQWTEVGHAVIAVGYREYQANGERFLRVLDGWNRTSDRYIFFNSNHFTSKNGIAMKVMVKK